MGSDFETTVLLEEAEERTEAHEVQVMVWVPGERSRSVPQSGQKRRVLICAAGMAWADMVTVVSCGGEGNAAAAKVNGSFELGEIFWR